MINFRSDTVTRPTAEMRDAVNSLLAIISHCGRGDDFHFAATFAFANAQSGAAQRITLVIRRSVGAGTP